METWWLLGVLAGEDLALLMPWVAISSLTTSLLEIQHWGGLSALSVFQDPAFPKR